MPGRWSLSRTRAKPPAASPSRRRPGDRAMLIARWLALLLLLAAAMLFALYAVTGQAHYKRLGLAIPPWTALARVLFFGWILGERLTLHPLAPPPEAPTEA